MGSSDNAQLIEEGDTAAGQLHRSASNRSGERGDFVFDVIVIGGGQAGLSVGYHLSRAGARFLIVDAGERIGDSWRRRWDSLRLFTAAKFDGLDGLRFPAPRDHFPTKDEMAAYLESYARCFSLPVQPGTRVERLSECDGRFVLETNRGILESRQVVVAMGKYQRPRIPPFASRLSTTITQLHSSEYRNLSQLEPGAVLLVGAGNSGADIALEVARAGCTTWLAGSIPGEVPFRPESLAGRHVVQPLLLRWVFHRLLTVETRIGRRVRPAMLKRAVPLIRVKSRDLEAAGVERVPRVTGVRGGLPLLEDGRTLQAANVLWSTGFQAGFTWIDLPVFGADGVPVHRSGVVENVPGLYFVGLHFLHAASSGMIHGVGRDAARIVEAIKNRDASSQCQLRVARAA